MLSLGVVPGNKMALIEYQWMDCYGQPCSPLKTKRSLVRRGSSEIDGHLTTSMRLLSGEDERKVLNKYFHHYHSMKPLNLPTVSAK